MVTFSPETKPDDDADDDRKTKFSKSNLVAETSPLQEQWLPLVTDDERQSYAAVLPFDVHKASWTTYTQLDAWFEALHPSQFINSTHSTVDKRAWTAASYHGQPLLRQTAWVTLDPACTCDYGYSDTWQTQSTCPAFRRIIADITEYVQDATGQTFNACNLNYYPPGAGIGWHADDEWLWNAWHEPVTIVSLSLCRGADDGLLAGARKFMVRVKDWEYHAGDHPYDVVLKHGDIMTMEGFFQKHYLHAVWPGDGYSPDSLNDPFCQGERINITWRTIVQHLDGSPNYARGKTCPLSKHNAPFQKSTSPTTTTAAVEKEN